MIKYIILDAAENMSYDISDSEALQIALAIKALTGRERVSSFDVRSAVEVVTSIEMLDEEYEMIAHEINLFDEFVSTTDEA